MTCRQIHLECGPAKLLQQAGDDGVCRKVIGPD